MRSESSIEHSVVQAAKKLGIRHSLKFAPVASSGWPDRLFLLPGGRVLFIEFKRQGGRPRPLQSHRIQQLRSLGFAAEWFDNADAALRYLAEEMATPPRAT